jgi:ABC-2 type transport system permease protein
MGASAWPPSTGPPPSATAPCRPWRAPAGQPLIGILVASAGLPGRHLRPSASSRRRSRARSAPRQGRRADTADLARPPPGLLPAPALRPRGFWAQLVARTRLDMRQVFKSPAYFVLLAWACSTPWRLVHRRQASLRRRPLSGDPGHAAGAGGQLHLIPMIVAIYYAGELVWRERDRKTHEIVDATPAPDWVFVAPRSWPSRSCWSRRCWSASWPA